MHSFVVRVVLVVMYYIIADACNNMQANNAVFIYGLAIICLDINACYVMQVNDDENKSA